MPFENIPQPEIVPIREGLRLRKFDGDADRFLAPYQDPYLYQNFEGIFDDAKKPDLDYVRWMCGYLDHAGEFYLIEAEENGAFVPIGDVTVKPENPPIAIWYARWRGIGVGTAVMEAVIRRLRDLGFSRIAGSGVFQWNLPSQHLHEKLGFRCVAETERERIYELELR